MSNRVKPPEFVPFIVNRVRTSSSVGVPDISPVAVSKTKPAGSVGLIDHETISPGPVTVDTSGKSLLTVLLTKLKSLTE